MSNSCTIIGMFWIGYLTLRMFKHGFLLFLVYEVYCLVFWFGYYSVEVTQWYYINLLITFYLYDLTFCALFAKMINQFLSLHARGRSIVLLVNHVKFVRGYSYSFVSLVVDCFCPNTCKDCELSSIFPIWVHHYWVGFQFWIET